MATLHEMMTHDKSLGFLVRELSEDLSTLVRSEVALAKIELKQTATGLGMVAAFFGVALMCALGAMAFFFVTAVLLLGLVLPYWLSALILAGALLLIAAGVALVGVKKFSSIEFAPNDTIENVKEDVKTIRSSIKRSEEERF
ncbi:MAG: phage holin family protein [Thermoanaerobaculia bacterium]